MKNQLLKPAVAELNVNTLEILTLYKPLLLGFINDRRHHHE